MDSADLLTGLDFISSYSYMDKKGIEDFEEGLLAVNQICFDKYVHFNISSAHGELISDYLLGNGRVSLDLIAVTKDTEVYRIKNLTFTDGFSDGRFCYSFEIES